MSAPPTAEWYLEVAGNKTGPYTATQILDFARSGKLLPHHRVTAPHLGNQWITVEQLAHTYAQGMQSGGGFQPPPKPHALEKQTSYSPTTANDQVTDPMLGLFDALQAAKDRKAPRQPMVAASHGPVLRESMFDGIPSMVWMGAGGVALLGLVAWGFFAVLKQQGTGLNKFESMLNRDSSAQQAQKAPRGAGTVAAAPTAATPALKTPASSATAAKVAPKAPVAATRSGGGYPFGRVGQPLARPLNSPALRSPAQSGGAQSADPRDLERERERQREEQELERQRSMFDGGREPDSVGGGLAPSPESGAAPAINAIPKDGPPPAPADNAVDINSSRID